ncbi:MAG: hypothetical protein JWM19_853 [Actinomycetia bacterium]|nr:hypothetical protein [Actinomycetes bacterium]
MADTYNPARPCPKCGSEGPAPAHHPRPVAGTFGSGPPWPCSDPGPGQPAGEHMCLRCAACGHAWTEAAIMAPPLE